MKSEIKIKNRHTIASGRFYSANPNKLNLEIKELMEEASNRINCNLPAKDSLAAVIAPHAGYVYSGIVAASSFLQLNKIPARKNVFLIGSSHQTDFDGASIYNIGHYNTPFGELKVNFDVANNLIENSQVINFVETAHIHEHTLEVMLPFLYYCWKNSFKIIPIIIATHNIKTCKELARVLLPYFNNDNIFVISTDLSHYPNYLDAIETDKMTIESVIDGIPDNLLNQLNINKNRNITNLATSMCGWSSVITLMYMTSLIKRKTKYVPILYQNSGDAKLFGDKERVVGYQSIGVYYE